MKSQVPLIAETGEPAIFPVNDDLWQKALNELIMVLFETYFIIITRQWPLPVTPLRELAITLTACKMEIREYALLKNARMK